MFKKLLVWVAVFFAPALTGYCAEQASVRFFCLSLQFQSVTLDFGLESLAFTMGSPNNPPDGELRPLFNPNAPTHGSGFILTDPSFGTAIQGEIAINVPAIPDTTGDGFSDFFKTSQTVASTTTTGVYESYDGLFSGTVSAVWSRGAGSANGFCAVTLNDATFDNLGTFNMPFSLFEYQGTMNYTGGATIVDATIALVQLPDMVNSLSGPLEFIRSATNGLNQIFLQPGAWTNNSGQTLVYTNAVIQRDLVALTNYYGTISFFDGNPSTPDPDYFYWEISIKDGNDANGNGVPDLTDPASAAPVAPQLGLASNPGGLTLMLTATLGGQVTIQSAPALPAVVWGNALTVTVTNLPQIIMLGTPATNQYWRAVIYY